jgi:dynein heavy chain
VAFPRFYFLSPDEVLDIIAASGNEQMDKVQGMLNKIFDGLTKFEINEQAQPSAMISKEGEKVPFKTPIKVSGAVEIWLDLVQKEMK